MIIFLVLLESGFLYIVSKVLIFLSYLWWLRLGTLAMQQTLCLISLYVGINEPPTSNPLIFVSLCLPTPVTTLKLSFLPWPYLTVISRIIAKDPQHLELKSSTKLQSTVTSNNHGHVTAVLTLPVSLQTQWVSPSARSAVSTFVQLLFISITGTATSTINYQIEHIGFNALFCRHQVASTGDELQHLHCETTVTMKPNGELSISLFIGIYYISFPYSVASVQCFFFLFSTAAHWKCLQDLLVVPCPKQCNFDDK